MPHLWQGNTSAHAFITSPGYRHTHAGPRSPVRTCLLLDTVAKQTIRMKLSHTQPCVLLLLLLICCACLLQPGEARGGRGRGGGSFGGLFGGWRSKYGSKSSSSSGGGRRVVSGSPVHTAMNVPKVPPPPPPPPKPMPKPQIPSYPRQQLPPGYNYAATAPGAGTYYANAQALPTGAVYYAQPPSFMGSGK